MASDEHAETAPAPVAARASPASIRAIYEQLYHSGQSLSKLKDAVIGGRFFDTDDGAPGVAGRSLAWKVFLSPPEPLHPPENEPPQLHVYLDALRASRAEFSQLLLEKMRAPDGSYEDGFVAPGTDAPPEKTGGASNLERNNPLSLDVENPWKEWFASVELRKTIQQDVERTFPDIPYFRDPGVQAQLTNILFLYSAMHPAIGYRQGMHELLAPLLYAIDYDSLPEGVTSVDADLRELCARRWVAADAWALFARVMHAASPWYEWREDAPAPGPAGQPAKPHVAPIITACNRIQHEILRRVDPVLHARLASEGVEPQIFGIRWLRLLFTREFAMRDAMVLWDGLLAADATLGLAPWLAVAMLLRIRTRLIPADYSEQLTLLLRYPPAPAGPGAAHITLLLHQAALLQMAPTPATGASIALENQGALGIPVEVPEPAPRPARGARQGRRLTASTDEPPARPAPYAGMGQAQSFGRGAAAQYGLPEIARNLYDRGEALGINKTIFNAVSEIKRNLPDIAANFNAVRSPGAGSAGYGAYPLVDDRPEAAAAAAAARPPWEPRARSDIEHEVRALHATQRRLGASVGWIVDALLLDESGCGADPVRAAALAKKKAEALEALAYVRDVLNGAGAGAPIDEERLMSAEELKAHRARVAAQREAERQKELERAARRPLHTPSVSLPSVPTLPPPVPMLPPAAHSPPQSATRPVEAPASPPAPSAVPARPTVKTQPPPPPATSQGAPSAALREAPWNYPRPVIPSPIGTLPAASPAPAPTPKSSAAPTTRSAITPSSGAAPAYAPWNYTPSDFSGKSGFGAAVHTSLAAPPRAQGNPRAQVGESGYPPRSPTQKVVHDPLGAIS